MSRIENACPFGYAADQCCGCDRCQSPGWQWVRISDVMVEMLRGEGCGPVHIRVEPRPGNEVELIATRVTPHAEAIRVLVKLRKHLCPSCDLDDTEWAEIGGFNRGIDAAVAALRSEGEGGGQ